MQKDDLFELIHSMNKIEKSHFKKYAQRHIQKDTVNYIRLFDIISKMNSYNEEKFIKKLQDKSLIKNLPRLKNYLYELILKSLRSISTIQSPEYQIKENLLRAEMLMERALPEQSKKFILKARAVAQNYDLPLEHIEANLTEMKLEYNFTINQNNRKNIDALHKENIRKIEEFKIQEELTSILLHLSISHSYTENNESKALIIQNIEKHELLNIERYSSFSVKNKIYINLINNFIKMQNQYNDKVESDLVSIIQLLESDPHIKKLFPAQYGNSLLNLSSILMSQKKYDEGFHRLEQFRTEYLREQTSMSKSFSRKAFTFYCAVKALSTIESGKMDIPDDEVNEMINHYNFELAHNGDQTVLGYLSMNLAYYLFVHGEYRKCNKIINTIINNKLSTNHTVKTDALVLNFMNHYHLNNYDYLEKTIKLISKTLENTENNEVYGLLINYMKNYKKEIIIKSDANTFLIGLKMLLKATHNNDSNIRHRIITENIFSAWIDTVINEGSFYETLKQMNSAHSSDNSAPAHS